MFARLWIHKVLYRSIYNILFCQGRSLNQYYIINVHIIVFLFQIQTFKWKSGCSFSGNATSSTVSRPDGIYFDKSQNDTQPFSTTRRRVIERSNVGSMDNDFKNLVQRNWKPITILFLVLACIVLSITYSQPLFTRIREKCACYACTSQYWI